ncbi:hypothetical protein HYT53_01735 [Candidatus Woesearchaeota archaeon]|nr:hypothetical protein [Candidatus Woesearchaeota archaeon]
MTLTLLTRLQQEGRLKGGDNSKNSITEGLIVPPFNPEFTVVSRVNEPNFQGVIGCVQYVREATTKEPLILKPTEYGPFPFSNELLDDLHSCFSSYAFGFEGAREYDKRGIHIEHREGYEYRDERTIDRFFIYKLPPNDNPLAVRIDYLAVGIDPIDRETPGRFIKFLNGDSLKARVILSAGSQGVSPTEYYKPEWSNIREHEYTTEEVQQMLDDKRFDLKRIQESSKRHLEKAQRHLPQTKEIGNFLVLGDLWQWL